MRRSLVWIVLGAVMLAPAPAFAGRTFYGWLYGTEVMPERGVELQTWVLERDGINSDANKETDLWVGPLVGITDQLELAMPLEFSWTESQAEGADFTLARYGVELRYRLVTQDPVTAPAFAPLVRVAVKRDVVNRDATIVEADLVGSYEKGRFHALADLGFFSSLQSGNSHEEAHPGAGFSIQAVGDLRLGAEIYGEFTLDNDAERWLAVGPNLAWTHGRFWLSAAYLVGVLHINAAPRMMWGVAF